MEWLGRRDSQVKLRGFRIEPGEIEHALRQLPEVRQAVVLHRTDLPGEPALVAYLVVSTESRPAPEELRDALRASLPAYMVPARFVVLDEMPVNRSGKTDKRALPLPTAEPDRADAEYVAPSSAAEKILAEIWREVLGLSRIGVHDDFFRVGGRSLSTVRVSLMAAARGLPVSVGDLIAPPPSPGWPSTPSGRRARACPPPSPPRYGSAKARGSPCGACTPPAAAPPGSSPSPAPCRRAARCTPSRRAACSAASTRAP
ncbi:D-alanine--D-alanyl carrier protein ligase [Streptomyces hirsutus]